MLADHGFDSQLPLVDLAWLSQLSPAVHLEYPTLVGHFNDSSLLLLLPDESRRLRFIHAPGSAPTALRLEQLRIRHLADVMGARR